MMGENRCFEMWEFTSLKVYNIVHPSKYVYAFALYAEEMHYLEGVSKAGIHPV